MKFLLLIGYALLFLRIDLNTFSDTPLFFLSNLLGAFFLLIYFYTRRKLLRRKIIIGIVLYTFANLYIFFIGMFNYGINIMNESSFIILISMFLHFSSVLFIYIYPIFSLSQVIRNFKLYDTVIKRLVRLHLFVYGLSAFFLLSAFIGFTTISEFYPYINLFSGITVFVTAFWILIRLFFTLNLENEKNS